MLKKLLVIATLTAGLISTQASAAFVSTDWKVVGDAKATLDTSTGMEWLKITHADNKSRDFVLSETQSGGQYAGWRIPTLAEVRVLFNTLYFDYSLTGNSTFRSTTTTSGYWNDAKRFYDLFGQTDWRLQNGAYITHGIAYHYADNGTDWVYSGVIHRNNPTSPRTYTIEIIQGKAATIPTSSTNEYYSTFLVSDGGITLSSINDPMLNINNPNAPINTADVSAPLGLAGAGLLMIMLGGRRKAV